MTPKSIAPRVGLVSGVPARLFVLFFVLYLAFLPTATFGAPCPPPPPLVLVAPSVVGAGSPNRVATIAFFQGAMYAWTITNGTITSGAGTNQIAFTAGSPGTLMLQVSVTLNGCPYGGGFANVTVAPAGEAVLFYPVTPCRLVDTRDSAGPLGGPALGASGMVDRAFPAAGACGIPAGATSLSVDLAVVAPASPGVLELYAADSAPTGTTSISFDAATTRANNSVVAVAHDGSGSFAVKNSATSPVDLVVDVNGYFE